MRIHVLQHVPFETPEEIAGWSEANGHVLTCTHLYAEQRFPAQTDYDALVVMGGPMGVYDDALYPWLVSEKKFVHSAIQANKPVLGVCLGAQLIAEVLGARVYRNEEKEIGWHPVQLTKEAKENALFRSFPDSFVPFHWHGDTFELPESAVRMAGSAGCANQAFIWGDRVVGLQFHLECSEAGIERLISFCPEDITEGRYVQQAAEMVNQKERVEASNMLLADLLDAWLAKK